MTRQWSLTGAPNARDLGGLVGAGGRPVRSGVLIRASGLGRLVDDDLPTLGKLGLSCVLDLRAASEIEVAPPDRLVGEPTVVHVPVHDPEHPVFTYVSAVMLGHDLSAYEALAREGTTGAMEAIYRWFVAGPAAAVAFSRAVRTVAEASNLPLLFHCSAGKDRTGWLSVILLTALGVDQEAILADYLRTNELADGVNDAILGAMLVRRPGLDLEAIRPVLEARESYLAAAYAEVDRLHGGMDAYLRDVLGIDDALRATLRERLLD
ncbi:tyrosine-protein phosphatase [Asanoa siamensis]|uniref:Protein-tyrosine-phosphatase n=1 Tax=Asanoa siamensis TaxID=926357 RepID=A0ABQ4CMW6_9ACTN|nr:tyrosine-protein phosphatase [Asanoa siamensis]GIF72633.1 protein-tyrosine-phosphatase [Asanoa siamensis]